MSEPHKDNVVAQDALKASAATGSVNTVLSSPPVIEKKRLSRADLDSLLNRRNQPPKPKVSDAPESLEGGAGEIKLTPSELELDIDVSGLPPSVRDLVRETVSQSAGNIPRSNGTAKITVTEDGVVKTPIDPVQTKLVTEAVETKADKSPPQQRQAAQITPQPSPVKAEQPRHAPPVAPPNQPGAQATPRPANRAPAVSIIPGQSTISLAPRSTPTKEKQPVAAKPPSVMRTGPVRVPATNGQMVVYFSGNRRPPAAIKVDEKHNKVEVGPASTALIEKVENAIAAKEQARTVSRHLPGGKAGAQQPDQSVAISPDPAESGQGPAQLDRQSEKPAAAPNPDDQELSNSRALSIEAAKELAADAAPDDQASQEAEIVERRPAKQMQKAHPKRKHPIKSGGNKSGGKKVKYKSPPLLPKGSVIFSLCLGVVVLGFMAKSGHWHGLGGSSPKPPAVISDQDQDGFPQPETASPPTKNSRKPQSQPPLKATNNHVAAPPVIAQAVDDSMWKITPKKSEGVPVPAPIPVPSPSKTLPAATKMGDELPAGMVPAVPSAGAEPKAKGEDVRSIVVNGVKMYVPTEASVGNIDSLGIDTDFAPSSRLGEDKGGCEAVPQPTH